MDQWNKPRKKSVLFGKNAPMDMQQLRVSKVQAALLALILVALILNLVLA